MLKNCFRNAYVGLSCAACVLALLLWAVSIYRSQSVLLLHFRSGNLWLGWVSGRVWVQWAEPIAIPEIGNAGERFSDRPVEPGESNWLSRPGGLNVGGVCLFRGPLQEIDGQLIVRETYVALPLYLVAIPLALLALHAYRSRRRHHRRPGHCVACGYDLRATPVRCPECGTIAHQGGPTAA